MGTKANRDSEIKDFVVNLLSYDGLKLYEKWFEHLQALNPGHKIPDSTIRDEMLAEIITLVSKAHSLILDKKDKMMVEEILNKFLRGTHLLQ